MDKNRINTSMNKVFRVSFEINDHEYHHKNHAKSTLIPLSTLSISPATPILAYAYYLPSLDSYHHSKKPHCSQKEKRAGKIMRQVSANAVCPNTSASMTRDLEIISGKRRIRDKKFGRSFRISSGNHAGSSCLPLYFT